MGDPNVKSDLNSFDVISVFLYRGGIIISSLSLVYAAVYFYYLNIMGAPPNLSIFEGTMPYIVFWVFILFVGVSVSFLHLYSKKILKFVQALYIIGILIILGFTYFGENTLNLAFRSHGAIGKITSIGIGLVLAVFSAIGSKEAYCFKLKEGYMYSILSFILVLAHLFGFSPNKVSVFLLILIAMLAVLLSIRKLNHPLHYDIGDKRKYQA